MTKLTKAQEKKMRSIVGNATHKDWYMELEDFMADELSRQAKKYKKKIKTLELMIGQLL